MAFYRKALKNPNILVNDFEVLFLLLISIVRGYKDSIINEL